MKERSRTILTVTSTRSPMEIHGLSNQHPKRLQKINMNLFRDENSTCPNDIVIRVWFILRDTLVKFSLRLRRSDSSTSNK